MSTAKPGGCLKFVSWSKMVKLTMHQGFQEIQEVDCIVTYHDELANVVSRFGRPSEQQDSRHTLVQSVHWPQLPKLRMFCLHNALKGILAVLARNVDWHAGCLAHCYHLFCLPQNLQGVVLIFSTLGLLLFYHISPLLSLAFYAVLLCHYASIGCLHSLRNW